MTPDDENFLRRAIELAAQARAAGDAPFGSLLVGPAGTRGATACPGTGTGTPSLCGARRHFSAPTGI
jgi:tRNA(Arg) A34 adenosine deaminase TadA